MWDIFRESVALYNLPLTVFLGLCLVYWLFVSLGALDLKSLHVNVDGHGTGDLHSDTGVDFQTDSGTDMHSSGYATGPDHEASADGSPLAVLLRVLNAKEVPLMVVLSFLFLFMWMIAIPANYYLNPVVGGDRSYLLALGFALPNFLISVVLTRIVTAPFKKIMRTLMRDEEQEKPIVGRSGFVCTTEINTGFGRIEVNTKGAPLVLHARVREGSIERGREVLIYDHDSEKNVYWVKPL